ncbi:MAG: TIGR02757 family protein [Bacteroidetes bacterium]|nr:TIGR02757 family protein [Bacteroidota bacterium]
MSQLCELLNQKAAEFNNPSFIENDPICIPHHFSKKADIEIAGFFAATFAWGQRITIINKARELMELMDMAPHEFVVHHTPSDLEKLIGFKHRTFNSEDLNHFLSFLKQHYQKHNSLESAFLNGSTPNERLTQFHNYFFAECEPKFKTRKHVATPARNSTCKRLNMYLRWMVRQDDQGVDFGIWNGIKPSELLCPYDVHVDRMARKYGLVTRKQIDWQTVIELTNNLKKFDPEDPVKYDFALFGMGVIENAK